MFGSIPPCIVREVLTPVGAVTVFGALNGTLSGLGHESRGGGQDLDERCIDVLDEGFVDGIGAGDVTQVKVAEGETPRGHRDVGGSHPQPATHVSENV